MPDQTVQVTFTPPNRWTFDPPTPRMTAAGKIKLLQHSANAAWKFVKVEVTGGGDQFHPTVNPNGTHATIDDKFTAPGLFPYTVTVALNGQQYSSSNAQRIAADHPPVIENAPSLQEGGPEPS